MKAQLFHVLAAALGWPVQTDRQGPAAGASAGETFLDSLIENIPDMIFVKEARELRFVRFNRAGERLLGYSRQEMIGKNDYDLFPKPEAEYFTNKDRQVLANRRVLDIPEETIHTRLLGERILHTKKVPLYDSNGNPIFLLGISEDITGKKQAELERDRSREQVMRLELERDVRERFISTLSHDLRTPLTTARASAELLQRFPDNAGYRRSLPMSIITSITSADRMIQDLLDAGRAQAGKRPHLEIDPIDLRLLLDELLHQMSLIHGDRFILSGPNECPGQWGRDALRRIFENLISNAVKYGKRDQAIKVSLHRTGDRVQVSVHNWGKSLSIEETKSIFQPYQRALAAERQQLGWGLGLTIVKSLTEAHGGTVMVRSAPDTGTLFTIDLPRDSRPFQPESESGKAA